MLGFTCVTLPEPPSSPSPCFIIQYKCALMLSLIFVKPTTNAISNNVPDEFEPGISISVQCAPAQIYKYLFKHTVTQLAARENIANSKSHEKLKRKKE